MDIGRVNLSLDHVQYRDVAALLSGDCRDHAVLGLKQPPHDVEHCRLAYRLRLLYLVTCEWGVGGHKEVAAGSRY